MKSINVVCPINQLGYGITSLNIIKNLNHLIKVGLWCIGQPQVTTQEDADIISSCINNTKFFDIHSPCLRIWHQHDMSQFIGKGSHIGFPIFELDTFNKLEKHHLESLDRIFVCSSWAKDIVSNNISFNPNNINVIPLGVDTQIFKPSEQPKTKTTKFFNCGKWEIRKGHDVLIEIFNKAFNKEDDVELIMMCDNPFYSESEQSEWIKLYKTSKLGDKITMLDRQPTQKEVYNIMSQCHCGIFPARAEGWNLELLEMMACGKQVITTNYAAHTEFCNSQNSLLAPIQQKEIAYDGKWFHGQGNWAKIDDNSVDFMVNALRNIHNLNISNSLQINEEGIKTAQKFNWQNSAKEILNVLQLF